MPENKDEQPNILREAQSRFDIAVVGVEHDLDKAPEIAQRLVKADCILFEYVGKTAEDREHATELVNAITEGQYTAEKLQAGVGQSDDFICHVAAGLAGSNILMLPIDTAEDNTIATWQAVASERSKEAAFKEAAAGDNPEEQARALAQYLVAGYLSDEAREQQMLHDIEAIAQRLAKNPGLNDVRRIHVLVGAAHSGLAEALSVRGWRAAAE